MVKFGLAWWWWVDRGVGEGRGWRRGWVLWFCFALCCVVLSLKGDRNSSGRPEEIIVMFCYSGMKYNKTEILMELWWLICKYDWRYYIHFSLHQPKTQAPKYIQALKNTKTQT